MGNEPLNIQQVFKAGKRHEIRRVCLNKDVNIIVIRMVFIYIIILFVYIYTTYTSSAGCNIVFRHFNISLIPPTRTQAGEGANE